MTMHTNIATCFEPIASVRYQQKCESSATNRRAVCRRVSRSINNTSTIGDPPTANETPFGRRPRHFLASVAPLRPCPARHLEYNRRAEVRRAASATPPGPVAARQADSER